jgi:endogenous inhibitor of DNA gyrase (YacG/DUF329 family)
MDCPICQSPTPPRAENRFYPFCSQRCQLVDLGRWLDGDYRIPGEPVDDIVAVPPGEDGGDVAGHGATGNGGRRDAYDDDDLQH